MYSTVIQAAVLFSLRGRLPRRACRYAAPFVLALVAALPATAQSVAPTAPTIAPGSTPPAQAGNTSGQAGAIRTSTSRQDQFVAVPQPPEPPTEFQRLVFDSTGQQLPIFGASLFRDVPSTFAPVDNIPVAPDYVIGPGDELRIQLYGQQNQQGSFTVDRTGNITYPQLGSLHVAGVKASDLPGFLKAQLSRVYRNFELTVNLGELRSIQVFVAGSARRPGSYTVSSLSTLLNALFASGGPLPQGSLRDIQLQRAGQATAHFDLYDLLLHGDKSKDLVLAPGDVIFIPPVGAQVALSGSVDTPAIYEVLPGTTVNQAVALAGGETAVALGSQVRIERISDHAQRSLADVDLTRYDPVLANGDIVEVGEITGRYKNAVTLRGNVAQPGRYVWKPGMRISDLVPAKSDLITRDYYLRRNALGTTPLAYQAEGVQVVQDRGATQAQIGASGRSNPSVGSTASNSTAATGGGSVGGALTGTNGIFGQNTDVVLSAPDLDWSYAVIERMNDQTLKTMLIPFNPGRLFLEGDQSQNLELLAGDIVTFFSTADLRVPTSQQTRFVRLEGEFVASGIYSVEPGETLRHLLTRAGGFTPDAYLYASEFTRQSTRRVQQQRLNEFADSLEAQLATQTANSNASAISGLDTAAAGATQQQATQTIARLRNIPPNGRVVLDLKPDSAGVDSVPDLPLEDGDRFVVPRVPSTVAVEGQVYSANAFVFQRGRKERDYLKQAGGPERGADQKREFILRADGSVFSRQYGDVAGATIFPGDTIVVPPRLQKPSILRSIIDISSIVGSLGVGIAALSLIATN